MPGERGRAYHGRMNSRATTQVRLPDWALPAAVTVTGILSAIMIAADLDSPLRALLVLAFLFFGPGLALTTLLQIRDPVQQFALAVATSLAVDALVAVSLLYLAIYTYKLGFAIVATITAAALVFGSLRGRRAPPDDPPPRDPAAAERASRAELRSRLAGYTEPPSRQADS